MGTAWTLLRPLLILVFFTSCTSYSSFLSTFGSKPGILSFRPEAGAQVNTRSITGIASRVYSLLKYNFYGGPTPAVSDNDWETIRLELEQASSHGDISRAVSRLRERYTAFILPAAATERFTQTRGDTTTCGLQLRSCFRWVHVFEAMKLLPIDCLRAVSSLGLWKRLMEFKQHQQQLQQQQQLERRPWRPLQRLQRILGDRTDGLGLMNSNTNGSIAYDLNYYHHQATRAVRRRRALVWLGVLSLPLWTAVRPPSGAISKLVPMLFGLHAFSAFGNFVLQHALSIEVVQVLDTFGGHEDKSDNEGSSEGVSSAVDCDAIKLGDRIVSVNSRPVSCFSKQETIQKYLDEGNIGDVLYLGVERYEGQPALVSACGTNQSHQRELELKQEPERPHSRRKVLRVVPVIRSKRFVSEFLHGLLPSTADHNAPVSSTHRFGYVQFKSFTHHTFSQLILAVENMKESLQQQQQLQQDRRSPFLDALILDLRGNRGGTVATSLDIAALFVPPNSALTSVVSTAGSETYYSLRQLQLPPTITENESPGGSTVTSSGSDSACSSGNQQKDWGMLGALWRKLWRSSSTEADFGGVYKALNLLILVDSDTASSSELLAMALRDHRRAVIVGTPTVGKAKAQAMVPFEDQSCLVFTVSHMLSPSGNSWDAGLPLDLELPASSANLPLDVISWNHDTRIWTVDGKSVPAQSAR